MARVKVAKSTDLEVGACMTIHAEGQDLALYHVEGAFYATANKCAHRGGPLGEGHLEENCVTCPWHGWQFDVKTGASPTHEGAQVKTYPVHVEGEDLFVEI